MAGFGAHLSVGCGTRSSTLRVLGTLALLAGAAVVIWQARELRRHLVDLSVARSGAPGTTTAKARAEASRAN